MSEDVFVWPDGTWCYRHEASEFSHMSDDYYVLYMGTQEWQDFLIFGKDA